MEREELEQLIKDTDAFINAIYDQVSTLGRVGFLHEVMNFKQQLQELKDA